jgi:CRP/FNR family cyclic AMP-dependent transcriptional regulator
MKSVCGEKRPETKQDPFIEARRVLLEIVTRVRTSPTPSSMPQRAVSTTGLLDLAGGDPIWDIGHAMRGVTKTSRRGRRSSKDVKVELLRNVPLFSACSKRDLRRIAGLVEEMDVSDRSVLIRQGEPGRDCFVIAEGKAKATVRGSGTSWLGPGDVVGEMSLLDQAPRAATVTAWTDMHLLVLTPRNFSALIAEFPPVARRIMAALAGRVRETEARQPSLASHLQASR